MARRRLSREVRVGGVPVGGAHPIVVQSMTTTPTQDVRATVEQSIRLAEAGCQIVRITAPNVDAARAFKDIRREFSAAGFASIPLVADIHFLPKAAMEAVEHVEKVRVNPGNYADKKKFAVKEYSDSEYEAELQRLHDAFSPLVLRAKALGRALRIGTNHGSLSDRIMNRYGDSPLGMCESALEFIRICESHGFHDIVISMKASNPKVMIQAYRLMVAKMAAEDMHYPLHLGVTEAGDGDDARIKSAIGIGSLLFDGLGDTIRVSLTEDPVAEIPVALQLAAKAGVLWSQAEITHPPQTVGTGDDESLDPYSFSRRQVVSFDLGNGCRAGMLEPPRVIVPAPLPPSRAKEIFALLRGAHARMREARIEGLMLDVPSLEEVESLPAALELLGGEVKFLVADLSRPPTADDTLSRRLQTLGAVLGASGRIPPPARPLIPLLAPRSDADLEAALRSSHRLNLRMALAIPPRLFEGMLPLLESVDPQTFIYTLPATEPPMHAIGSYRRLADLLRRSRISSPIWIRNTSAQAVHATEAFGDRLIDASILSGALICDGIGDLVSIETVPGLAQATALTYNVLQGARARSTKTEYVACPSCGRTLFDLQTTTQRIREATGHLKGVTIAVMGCIVNGPGEMADADFGYVGGAPGKINLYVGKTPVEFNIPSERAVDRLVELIKQHGKWVDAPVESPA